MSDTPTTAIVPTKQTKIEIAVERLDALATDIVNQWQTLQDSFIRHVAPHVLQFAESVYTARRLCRTTGNKWESWVKKHLPFGVRNANNYVRIWRDREKLEITDKEGDLNLTTAMKMIRPPASENAGRPAGGGTPVQKIIHEYVEAYKLPDSRQAAIKWLEEFFAWKKAYGKKDKKKKEPETLRKPQRKQRQTLNRKKLRGDD